MGLEIAFCSTMLSPQGKGQVGDAMGEWHVADQFRKAVPYRPMTKNVKRLKVKLTMKWSSRCVTDQFHKVVPYRPTTQNAKRFKVKAGRR
ncbi:hypothetical protein H5410_004931 [Solanum commersonii]|uniref:Uncharacterized protein n=1 Tax=Solanum commersonii TaxID=4109 RepID=A0A9J6A583_SOLCO|nr:hypothetical protein H5410_004931 [Solanum commersonii]